jgi:hypothetical protein
MKPLNKNLPHLLVEFDTGAKQEVEHEVLLAFLRQRECSKIDCIQALMLRYNYSLQTAKRVVHLSHTWRDRRRQDDTFHQRLEQLFHDDNGEDPS